MEFGGESPLTMRYGLRVDIPHPLGPSTGGQWPLPIRHEPRQLTNILWAPRPELRRLYGIDHHRKNEPGVPKGWEDYHTGEGSHCPWGHPHKFQFSEQPSEADKHILGCYGQPAAREGGGLCSFLVKGEIG